MVFSKGGPINTRGDNRVKKVLTIGTISINLVVERPLPPFICKMTHLHPIYIRGFLILLRN